MVKELLSKLVEVICVTMVLLESVLYHIRVKSECLHSYNSKFYKLYYIKQHKGKKISVTLLIVTVDMNFYIIDY